MRLLFLCRMGCKPPRRPCVFDEMCQHTKQLRQGTKTRIFFFNLTNLSARSGSIQKKLFLKRKKNRIFKKKNLTGVSARSAGTQICEIFFSSCRLIFFPCRVVSCADSWHCKRSVFSVVYSPDGTKLASGSRDKTFKIWNAQTGQCVSTLSGHRYRQKL